MSLALADLTKLSTSKNLIFFALLELGFHKVIVCLNFTFPLILNCLANIESTVVIYE